MDKSLDLPMQAQALRMHGLLPACRVQVLADVDAVAAKLICLKSVFPGASPLKIITKLPKLLLLKTEAVQDDAQKVGAELSMLTSVQPSQP